MKARAGRREACGDHRKEAVREAAVAGAKCAVPARDGPPGPLPSLEHLDELTIEQSGDSLTLTNKMGRQRVLRTDGRKVREEKGPHGPEDVKAAWGEQGGLIVEVKAEEGPKRTEVYQLSNDGKRLFLTISLEGGPHWSKMRRVYDRAP